MSATQTVISAALTHTEYKVYKWLQSGSQPGGRDLLGVQRQSRGWLNRKKVIGWFIQQDYTKNNWADFYGTWLEDRRSYIVGADPDKWKD